MKITFPSLVALVLMVLKLTHVIDWSWWLVWAPLWAPAALALLCYAGYYLLLLFETPEAKKRRRLVDALEKYSNALQRR